MPLSLYPPSSFTFCLTRSWPLLTALLLVPLSFWLAISMHYLHLSSGLGVVRAHRCLLCQGRTSTSVEASSGALSAVRVSKARYFPIDMSESILPRRTDKQDANLKNGGFFVRTFLPRLLCKMPVNFSPIYTIPFSTVRRTSKINTRVVSERRRTFEIL